MLVFSAVLTASACPIVTALGFAQTTWEPVDCKSCKEFPGSPSLSLRPSFTVISSPKKETLVTLRLPAISNVAIGIVLPIPTWPVDLIRTIWFALIS